jgi:UDP-2,3-diacylglucosamine pyrophosphatase LpxH
MKVIVRQYPADMKHITLCPIADLHMGAKECMEREFAAYLKQIACDENALIILCGDLINNGIKSSVTNVYDEIYPPQEQKRRVVEFTAPCKRPDHLLGRRQSRTQDLQGNRNRHIREHGP